MSKLVISTNMSTLFEIKVLSVDGTNGECTIRFSLPDPKTGKDALVSFDGEKWMPAEAACSALRAFEDRFPMAFG